jgi:diguanylate cyclase (GGDEF)-like protein
MNPENILRSLRKCAPSQSGIAICGPDMRYLWHSDSWRAMYGLPADLIGQSHYDLFPGLPNAWKLEHQQVIREGQSFYVETPQWFENKNTGKETALVYGIGPGDLGPDGYDVIMVSTDVTDYARAQRILTQFQEESVIGKGVFEREGNDLRVVEWNRVAREVSPAIDLKGKLLGQELPGHYDIMPDEEISLMGAYLRVLATGEPRTAHIYFKELNRYFVQSVFRISETELGIEWFDDTERTQMRLSAEYAAVHDALTGAYDRGYLDQLYKEPNYSPSHAIFIDLDDFKRVNDTHGHLAGDKLLKEVVRRLEKLAGDYTFVRMSGDEFCFLLNNADEDTVIKLAQSACKALSEPFALPSSAGDSMATISAACGVAAFDTSLELTIKKADLAMYVSKAAGKGDRGAAGVPVWYEARMGQTYERKQRLLEELQTAIAENALEIYLQPQVDLNRYKPSKPEDTPVIGFEVLCRWKRRNGQGVSPIEFIPLAEENGHITALSLVVLAKACKACKELNSLPGITKPFKFSVNLSGGDLANPRLKQGIDKVIAESGIDPSWIVFEITETFVESLESARGTVQVFRDQGFKSYVDDTGTGAGTLALIFSFPVDGMKVEKDFVSRQLNSVKYLVGLGHSLGLSVVIEGIEDVEVANRLADMNADIGQGYLWGKPMPVNKVIEYWQVKAA